MNLFNLLRAHNTFSPIPPNLNALKFVWVLMAVNCELRFCLSPSLSALSFIVPKRRSSASAVVCTLRALNCPIQDGPILLDTFVNHCNFQVLHDIKPSLCLDLLHAHPAVVARSNPCLRRGCRRQLWTVRHRNATMAIVAAAAAVDREGEGKG